MLYNISFKEHLPEDGHSRWPNHVGGYAVYNQINLHNIFSSFMSAAFISVDHVDVSPHFSAIKQAERSSQKLSRKLYNWTLLSYYTF